MYGDGDVNKRMVRRRFKKFRDGHFGAIGHKRSGWPIETGNDQIYRPIENNPRYIAREWNVRNTEWGISRTICINLI